MKMYHIWIYECNVCGDEVKVEAELDWFVIGLTSLYGAGKCHCGGTYKKSGESYDADESSYRRLPFGCTPKL